MNHVSLVFFLGLLIKCNSLSFLEERIKFVDSILFDFDQFPNSGAFYSSDLGSKSTSNLHNTLALRIFECKSIHNDERHKKCSHLSDLELNNIFLPYFRDYIEFSVVGLLHSTIKSMGSYNQIIHEVQHIHEIASISPTNQHDENMKYMAKRLIESYASISYEGEDTSKSCEVDHGQHFFETINNCKEAEHKLLEIKVDPYLTSTQAWDLHHLSNSRTLLSEMINKFTNTVDSWKQKCIWVGNQSTSSCSIATYRLSVENIFLYDSIFEYQTQRKFVSYPDFTEASSSIMHKIVDYMAALVNLKDQSALFTHLTRKNLEMASPAKEVVEYFNKNAFSMLQMKKPSFSFKFRSVVDIQKKIDDDQPSKFEKYHETFMNFLPELRKFVIGDFRNTHLMRSSFLITLYRHNESICPFDITEAEISLHAAHFFEALKKSSSDRFESDDLYSNVNEGSFLWKKGLKERFKMFSKGISDALKAKEEIHGKEKNTGHNDNRVLSFLLHYLHISTQKVKRCFHRFLGSMFEFPFLAGIPLHTTTIHSESENRYMFAMLSEFTENRLSIESNFYSTLAAADKEMYNVEFELFGLKENYKKRKCSSMSFEKEISSKHISNYFECLQLYISPLQKRRLKHGNELLKHFSITEYALQIQKNLEKKSFVDGFMKFIFSTINSIKNESLKWILALRIAQKPRQKIETEIDVRVNSIRSLMNSCFMKRSSCFKGKVIESHDQLCISTCAMDLKMIVFYLVQLEEIIGRISGFAIKSSSVFYDPFKDASSPFMSHKSHRDELIKGSESLSSIEDIDEFYISGFNYAASGEDKEAFYASVQWSDDNIIEFSELFSFNVVLEDIPNFSFEGGENNIKLQEYGLITSSIVDSEEDSKETSVIDMVVTISDTIGSEHKNIPDEVLSSQFDYELKNTQVRDDLSNPMSNMQKIVICLFLCGCFGIIYMIWMARRQKSYTPADDDKILILEDENSNFEKL